MEKKESLKKVALVYREALKAVESLKDLDLSKEAKKSRVTFSNSKRVVALELRKHYILVHSPELKYLEKSKLFNPAEQKIKIFKITKDSRNFTYIRLYTLLELEDFKEVVREFSTINK